MLANSNLGYAAYKSQTAFKGETATDTGFLIHLYSISQEFSLVWFNLYTYCYIELMLINIGRILNSSAQAGNLVTTLSFEMIDYFFNKKGPTY